LDNNSAGKRLSAKTLNNQELPRLRTATECAWCPGLQPAPESASAKARLSKRAHFSGTITAFNVFVTVMTNEAIKYTGCIDSASELGIWAKLVAMVRNFIKNQIPEGYQDQDGFHFGIKHAE
jgi:hypothetical protein